MSCVTLTIVLSGLLKIHMGCKTFEPVSNEKRDSIRVQIYIKIYPFGEGEREREREIRLNLHNMVIVRMPAVLSYPTQRNNVSSLSLSLSRKQRVPFERNLKSVHVHTSQPFEFHSLILLWTDNSLSIHSISACRVARPCPIPYSSLSLSLSFPL